MKHSPTPGPSSVADGSSGVSTVPRSLTVLSRGVSLPAGQSEDASRRTTAPTGIKLVLPVWGYKFVRQFLDLTLPTLLSPGNVPAVASKLPAEFVILTSEDDEPFMRRHPNLRALSRDCTVSIRSIDHLITGANHSTTLTLAYAEAIRFAGPAMIDTCFLLLCSDYVVAEGSLGRVADRMINGASGVLAGNFQVAIEDALPWLQAEISRAATPALALSSRTLMRWGLANLHPTVVANTVNFPLNHNRHTNRLFWRADAQTLVGRFYLMHPVAVRPELADFVVAASFDYSFIPEMCPSGNIDVIVDSDEYLVVEMQPHDHESKWLRPGRLRPAALAKTLTEWTTQRHRKNARYSVVFHAGDLPESLGSTTAEADRFVGEVDRRMRRQPWSHRDHPYWRGALAAHREATGGSLDPLERWLALGLPDELVSRIQHAVGRRVLEAVISAFLGEPPFVRPWHPRWPDYRAVIERLPIFGGDQERRLLMVSDRPTVFTVSLSDGGERTVRLRTNSFLESRPDVYEPLDGSFDLCLLELSEAELTTGGELLDRIAPLMKPVGRIVVTVYNRRGRAAAAFAASMAFHSTRLMRAGTRLRETCMVTSSRFRWAVSRTSIFLAYLAYRRPWIGVPLVAITGGALAISSFVANAATRGRSARTLRPGRLASSFHMVLDVDPEGQDAYRYAPRPIDRRRLLERMRVADHPARTALLSRQRDVTPILYGAGIPEGEPRVGSADGDGRHDGGSTSRRLNLRTEVVGLDGPRRLQVVLSRYEFVAKMLRGRLRVGEVGYGDVLGTRVVLQEVGKVTVYDVDPGVVADIRRRVADRLPVDFHLHDIVAEPLPETLDGLYSLDMLARIAQQDEDAYLANLRGSLTDEGVLVLGSPVGAQQQPLNPRPDGTHFINCKSATEMRSLLERYFANVFLFPMDEEVVHAGPCPTADYLFAVCCGKRSS